MERKHYSILENVEVHELIEAYYSETSRGCTHAVADKFTGKSKKIANQLSNLTGYRNGKDLVDLFNIVAGISSGSKTYEEASREIFNIITNTYRKINNFGITAGNVDNFFQQSAELSKIMLDKHWAMTEKRMAPTRKLIDK